ncbi:MAG: Alpha-ketoglutarate-dependent dioxygenase AlkB [Rhodanobacteraceae bacterium]|jgi:alkylated DNA repair protein (DNA oxidative demethylase)|nr:MAG: Alpha-ketoglutarate-dependent dioxygenase AlkB [Rhodanobacteraceae bacterium]
MRAASLPLFEATPAGGVREELAPGAWVLRGFALEIAENLLLEIEHIAARSPFRNLVTPGGKTMSVAMTNCGAVGWYSDRRGYRYTEVDPETGKPWPAMPPSFAQLARDAARESGFEDYAPDVCLINRYEIGTRLTLHVDQDEHDHHSPIVSVSLGLPATFLFGGFARKDPQHRLPLAHGDVVVWGGPSRMRYHGVLPIREGAHPLTGSRRFNLTFRVAR